MEGLVCVYAIVPATTCGGFCGCAEVLLSAGGVGEERFSGEALIEM